nr:basic proline-rich protein isoform X2 [Vulpes vulpes]
MSPTEVRPEPVTVPAAPRTRAPRPPTAASRQPPAASLEKGSSPPRRSVHLVPPPTPPRRGGRSLPGASPSLPLLSRPSSPGPGPGPVHPGPDPVTRFRPPPLGARWAACALRNAAQCLAQERQREEEGQRKRVRDNVKQTPRPA